MAFKFKREEAMAILKACEGHTFGGAKPTCLFKLTQHLTLSTKEFRELVRYLKSVAMAGIHNGVVGCGLTYRQYLKSTYCAMHALDIFDILLGVNAEDSLLCQRLAPLITSMGSCC